MGHIGTIKIGAKGQNIFPTQIEKMLGVPQDILQAGAFRIFPQEAGEEIEPHQAALLCKAAELVIGQVAGNITYLPTVAVGGRQRPPGGFYHIPKAFIIEVGYICHNIAALQLPLTHFLHSQ